ncbi:MAG: hypothetical protein LBQ09_12335 [Acidobacteriaceae bacterium]|jgi:hypothetical protein|nr:hypothetical protein [Acidobacteriaceae bacterium]
MKITREVINDLWPLYAANESSLDTRELVDEFLAADPELAATLRRSTVVLPASSASTTPPDEARHLLVRTQQRLRRRSIAFGLAIFFTTVPMSFVFEHQSFHWLMWGKHSDVAFVYLAAAAACWIWYGLTRRQMSASGL